MHNEYFQKKIFWTLTTPQGLRVCVSTEFVRANVLDALFPFNLIYNMTTFRKKQDKFVEIISPYKELF